MRALMMGLFVTSLRICGDDAPPESSPPTADEVTARSGSQPEGVNAEEAVIAPTDNANSEVTAGTVGAADLQSGAEMGGTVIAAGPYKVEVLASTSGEVIAMLKNELGAVVEGTPGITLSATLQGEGEATLPITLAWDAARKVYAGKPEGDLRFVAGPADVSVYVSGATHAGRIDALPIAPIASNGGTVVVVGSMAAEVRVEGPNLEAYVTNASGVALDAEAPNVALTARVKGMDGAMHPLQLGWDATKHAYVAALTSVTLAPGPFELVARIDGRESVGRFGQIGVPVLATHGGSVVVTGGYSVEIVPKRGGEFEAYIVDPMGVSVNGGEGVALSIALGNGPLVTPLELTWDARTNKFKGRARGRVDFEAAPVRVNLTAGGRTHVGGVARGGILLERAARANAGADGMIDIASIRSGGTATVGTIGENGVDVNALRGRAGTVGNIQPPHLGIEFSGSASAGANERRPTKTRAQGSGSITGGIHIGH